MYAKPKWRDLVDENWRAEATRKRWTNEELDAAINERTTRLKAVMDATGGSFEDLPAEQLEGVKRLLGELEVLDHEVIDPDHQHPGHGTTGGGGRGEAIKPVASMWAAMQSQRFAIGSNPRVQVPAGVLWGAVTSPSDTLAPVDRRMPVFLGADRRYVFPALRSDPLSPLDTAIDWARQSVRALATPASMRRAIAATTTKPESALTVVLVHTALEQIAHKIAGVPNIVFRNAGIRSVIDNELRLGLAEALDAQAVAIINAAGMVVGGTGANLAIRIRKAMTTLQAAGFEPDTVALSPADAEALDLLLLDVLNSSNTLPNWKLEVRVGKSVTTGFVFDSKAFATVHASPISVAAFEENDGASNSQLCRGEFNAITTVEQVGAGVALGAQV